jgi:hypothetical protein
MSGGANFQDQFVAGAALEYLLHLLEKSTKIKWISEHTPHITLAARALMSAGATIGITWHYVASSGQLVIGGLTLWGIFMGLIHWFNQFAIQHGFGGLIRAGNRDAFRQVILEVLREEHFLSDQDQKGKGQTQ